MASVPLFGTGTGNKSSNVSAQNRTNLYVEQYQEQDKTSLALFSRPGLTRYGWANYSGAATTAGFPANTVVLGPVRGMSVNYAAASGTLSESSIYGVMGNVLFQLLGGVLYLQWANYLTSAPFGTNAGPVAITDDGINIAVCDGKAGYYAPLGTPAQMQPIPSANFPVNATSLCTVASHVICNDPAAVGRFRWCAAGDVTTWNALDFATAESNADPLVSVFEAHGELLLFGTRTIEFWAPTGDSAVFQRIGSSGILWGTTATGTIRKVGDNVAFLGRAEGGSRQVVLLNGYNPQIISTPDVENAINGDSSADSATAISYSIVGHQFYQLNLSATSWVYDVTNGAWSQFQTDGSRHAGNYSTPFQGKTIVSDYRDTRLYYLDPTVYTDDGNVIIREVTSRHIFNDLDRVSCFSLQVDCEVGVGIQSGQGSDPQIMLSVSKNGGHTFGGELWLSLGAVGSYLTRVVWRRLGASRDWVFKLRITDPVKVVIIGAAGEFQ